MTTVGFYVKAGRETGYGHVVRCLALADRLRYPSRYRSVEFYTNDEGAEKAKDYPVILGEPFVYHDVFIVDLEGGCPPALAKRLRDICKVLIVLNGVGYPDGDPGRLFADLVFYQGVTRRPHELDWAGFQGEWHEGPRWLILREDFQAARAAPGTHDPPRVVVACGGADPKDVTGKAVRALLGLDCFVHVIIGPANSGVMIVDVAEATGRNVKAVFNPPDMAGQLAWADVALVSYGMTAFECLALGLPTVALSVSPDHAASADLVAERSGGALTHLGEVERVGDAGIRAAVLGALGDAERLSGLARAFVDGKGAGRVADKIMEAFHD